MARMVPAFSSAVASFEHDDDSQPFGLYPGLERAKLALKSPQFRLDCVPDNFEEGVVFFLLMFFRHIVAN